jgi:hypothetical protein
MRSLDQLLGPARERHQSNLSRLRANVEALDAVVESPASDPYLDQLRGRTPDDRPDDADARERERLDDVRDGLPWRTTKGGDFGRSILDRVAASYRKR